VRPALVVTCAPFSPVPFAWGARRARHPLTWAGVSTSRPRRLNKEGPNHPTVRTLCGNNCPLVLTHYH